MDARPAPLFNPFLPEFRENPHPMLHRLRAADPVHWSPSIGVWVLTRYADVVAALHDPRMSSNLRLWPRHAAFFLRGGRGQSLEAVWSRWVSQVDPPDHTRLRALIVKAFSPRLVESMRPRIARLIDELLDQIAPLGEVDPIERFAAPLPIRVIAELLGVPPEDHPKIHAWTRGMLPALNPVLSAEAIAQVNHAAGAFREYFAHLSELRRRDPQADLLSALIAAQEGGQRLTEDELLGNCAFLALAGHATTTQLLTEGLLLLIRHPGEQAKLRARPELAAPAVEEVLRCSTPLQVSYRVATSAMEFGGKTIEARSMVFLSLAAANRDPERFADPDRFDIERQDNKHLAFAHGIHYCLGASLARLEAQLALPALLARMPGLELVEGSLKPPVNPVLRVVEAMRVRWRV